MIILNSKNVYSAKDIAKYCIYYCSNKLNRPISNLQLQKILYYTQASFLIKKNKPCFDEPIVAWKYGPVVVDEYHTYSSFKADEMVLDTPNIPKISEKDIDIINEICDVKSKHSAVQLVYDTHSEYPWINTKQNEIIDNEKIKNFFSEHEDLLRK